MDITVSLAIIALASGVVSGVIGIFFRRKGDNFYQFWWFWAAVLIIAGIIVLAIHEPTSVVSSVTATPTVG